MTISIIILFLLIIFTIFGAGRLSMDGWRKTKKQARKDKGSGYTEASIFINGHNCYTYELSSLKLHRIPIISPSSRELLELKKQAREILKWLEIDHMQIFISTCWIPYFGPVPRIFTCSCHWPNLSINLLRWVSPRPIKETFVPSKDFRYPFMQEK